MKDDQYIEDLESAFIDLMEELKTWQDVGDVTDLSSERCVEIMSLMPVVDQRYCKRHNIRSRNEKYGAYFTGANAPVIG